MLLLVLAVLEVLVRFEVTPGAKVPSSNQSEMTARPAIGPASPV